MVHYNAKHTFYIVDSVFPVLATLFVCLRLQAKRLKSGKSRIIVQSDDIAILLSLIVSYGWTVNLTIGNVVGNLGGHTNFGPDGLPVPGHQNNVFLQTNYASQPIAIAALCLTKISLLLLYSRLFNHQAFRIRTFVVVGLMIAMMIGLIFAFLFQCVPISNNWKYVGNEGCVDIAALYIGGICLNTFTDVLVLCWPIYRVWKLRMSWRRKLGIMVIFLLGGFVTIIGGLRIYFLAQTSEVLNNPYWADINYAYCPGILWTTVEINVGIICACLPLLRPVAQQARVNSIYTRMAYLWGGLSARSAATPSNTPSWRTKSSGEKGVNNLNDMKLTGIAAEDITLSTFNRASREYGNVVYDVERQNTDTKHAHSDERPLVDSRRYQRLP